MSTRMGGVGSTRATRDVDTDEVEATEAEFSRFHESIDNPAKRMRKQLSRTLGSQV